MSEPTAAPRTPDLLTIGVLVIALAAVFLAGFQVRDDDPEPVAAGITSGVTSASTDPTGVVTSGAGSASGKPDQLSFSATVTNRRDTNALALRATNHDVRAVTIKLKQNGVEAKDIQTASLSIQPRYDYRGRGERRLIGYTSTQRIEVLVRDLDKAGETLGGVTDAAGNAVRISGVSFSLSNQDEVIAQARDEAVKKSKAAAAALAEAAGREVGELVYVEEVVPQRYYGYGETGGLMARPMSADVFSKEARAGSVPISPGQLEFDVTVKVRWSLS